MKYKPALFLCLLGALSFFPYNLTARTYSYYTYETPVAKCLKNIPISEEKSHLEGVDCIYVINLDERPEKWEKMQELFDREGLKINRFAAINGWELSKNIQRRLAGPYPIRLRGGQIGCLLSHISAIKDAYERGFNIIWVLEDDIEIIGDVHQLPDLLVKLSEIDPDWDIFYTDIDTKDDKGEYIPSRGSDFRPDVRYFPLSFYTRRFLLGEDIMKIGQRFGMYSLLISRKGIKKILDYFTHAYLWTAIDIDIHYIPGIREYSSTRDIVSFGSRAISDTERELK